MLATSASRPAIFRETMRRVRLENESVNRNCPARLSQLSGRCQPFSAGFSATTSSKAKDDVAFSAVSPESGCVRSSNRYPPEKIRHILPHKDYGVSALRLFALLSPASPRLP